MYTRLQTTAPRQGGNNELACDDRVVPGITELAACGWRPRSEQEQSAYDCECTSSSNFQSRVGRAGVHEDASRSGESLARTEPEFAPVGCSELRQGVRGDAARPRGRSNAQSASPGTVAYGSGGVDGDTLVAGRRAQFVESCAPGRCHDEKPSEVTPDGGGYPGQNGAAPSRELTYSVSKRGVNSGTESEAERTARLFVTSRERPALLPIRATSRQALARHGIDRDVLPDDITVLETSEGIRLRRAAMRMQ